MKCTSCQSKKCRSNESCQIESFQKDQIMNQYHDQKTQNIVQAASELVDQGRAGTLSRIEEVIEFAHTMNYKKIGLAYCYGLEKEALMVMTLFERSGLKIDSVSCTVGAFLQDEVNRKSEIHNVSCNPIGQAQQMNQEGVDFVIVMGLCLGHDILFQKHIQADCTTLVVKDRTTGHSPLEAIKKLYEEE